jgi:23S rRNA pseudouridine2605 synthase
VDGRSITPRPPALYVALHKPAGFDTTRADPHAAHTVMELVLPGLEAKFGRGHPSVEGLHPVGRLDRDSEGLLLLTNDGAFTQALTHPRHGVTKTYLAEVGGRPTPADLEQLRTGVVIDGRKTRPARVRLLPGAAGPGGSRLELELREGRKRQVRRMLEAVGHPVRRLVRTAVGPVGLGSLKRGQYRMLTPAEVHALLEEAARGETAHETPATENGPSKPEPRAVPARKTAAMRATTRENEPKSGSARDRSAATHSQPRTGRPRKHAANCATAAPRQPGRAPAQE